jgi:hypothetical protein
MVKILVLITVVVALYVVGFEALVTTFNTTGDVQGANLASNLPSLSSVGSDR